MRVKVILQEKIRRLAGIGDIVEVQGGFARNYLLPMQKARVATKHNIAEVEKIRSELEKTERKRMAEARVRADAIQALGTVRLQVQTNEEGKLFGSVAAADIVDLLASQDTSVHKNEVTIIDGPIRFVGEYIVRVECYADVYADIRLDVYSDTVREKEEERTEQTSGRDVENAEDADSVAE